MAAARARLRHTGLERRRDSRRSPRRRFQVLLWLRRCFLFRRGRRRKGFQVFQEQVGFLVLFAADSGVSLYYGNREITSAFFPVIVIPRSLPSCARWRRRPRRWWWWWLYCLREWCRCVVVFFCCCWFSHRWYNLHCCYL